MSFVLVATGVISAGVGVYNAIQSAEQAKQARNDAKKAQEELDKQKDAFKSLDTSNPYLNMENVMEDLTVNQQAAEFQRSQQLQSQANIMQSMRGAAGSSGIAALAQTLASQGSLDAQKAQASIAQQEQSNMLAERQEAGRIQNLERQGEMISRQAEAQKIGSLMGMAADEVSVARGMEQAAEAQKMQAIQQAAMGTVDATMGGLSLGANPVVDAQQLSSYQQARGFGGGSTMNEATLKALGLNDEQIAAIMAGKI
tara:strand:- start:872 stop:1639 length:768 start_codon:yes stop_codon:yes gene_type:complete